MTGTRLAVTAMIVAGPALSMPAISAELPTLVRMSVPAKLACASGAVLLPDTRTCLAIGGSVRADLAFDHTAPVGFQAPATLVRTPSGSSFRPMAELRIDVRTPTALGDVRTYVSIRTR